QISQTEMMANQSGFMIEDDLDAGFPGAESGELEALRRQVKLLEVRYTKNHPDVRRLREMIGKLEAEEAASAETQAGLETTQEEAIPEFSMGQNFLQPQLEQINAEIRGLQHEIAKVQEQTAVYRSRVEQTPERQLELLEISRDYENLKALYDSMLNRKLEAEVSLNMEKKQKGEQFRVIDPAKLPEKPVEPDVRRILMLTLLLGLALGGGMAYGVEFIDTSFKNPEDLEKELKIPVLVSMPIRYTERELKGQRRKRLLLACSVGLVFMASATAIVIAAKGFDGTVNYVKNLLNIV
ncbi:MAG: GNVR domain-containing protein, partial [Desulfatiglandales bacterium]